MNEQECIVGIDLGTTNSEVAVFVGDRVIVMGKGSSKMLPSCVGLSPAGELLIGQSARNQQLIYPDRTIRSIKRKMGSMDTVTLGDKAFSPQEISALILRELMQWAQSAMKRTISKAVITVPAYFSDAQRSATREAGELAGLEVVRILNEPTAAGLAYGFGDRSKRTVMIYDLGGGTFDVSIVTMEGDITEVLATHGNNHLGGDDFDQLLVEYLLKEFQSLHGIDLSRGYPVAYSRLWWAAEDAKIKLSFAPYVQLREEALVTVDGKPLHLNMELSREKYEEMIRPLVESTLDSVAKAMADAGKGPRDLDAVLLVGGATRTPLVIRTLEERAGTIPRQDLDPDLCVALGAGVLASRLAGHEVERVLVDITPYSFGPSHLGQRGGVPYPYCYRSIIRRNTPLPITRTERYYTASPFQQEVEVNIFQGDDDDALKNILVGNFRVSGLTPMEQPNEVLIRMDLDLDGILKVAATEKKTGKSRKITISNALQEKSQEEILAGKKRLQDLYSARAMDASELSSFEDEYFGEDDEFGGAAIEEFDGEDSFEEEGSEIADGTDTVDPELIRAVEEASRLIERSRGLLEKMHPEDREEAIDIHERLQETIDSGHKEGIRAAIDELRELLFFVEGKE